MTEKIDLNRRVCDTCEHHEELAGKTNKMFGAAIFIWPIVSVIVLGFIAVNAGGIERCRDSNTALERKIDSKIESDRDKLDKRMDNIEGGILILQLNMKHLMTSTGVEYITTDQKRVTINEIQ